VIGEILDRVHVEGGGLVNTDLQTTLIPAGGAAIIEFKCEVPGTFILVDHSIFRAFNKGALGMLKVAGSEDKAIYSGKMLDEVYQAEGGAIQTLDTTAPEIAPARTKEERMVRGRRVYSSICAACHQAQGQGIAAAFPPLARSDFLNADKRRAIGVVVNGLSGPITVIGQKYEGAMPALGLSDEDIANVLTFVYNSWNNAGHEVRPEEVKAVRSSGRQ
jgi:nitrite reductase (NO-forming)